MSFENDPFVSNWPDMFNVSSNDDHRPARHEHAAGLVCPVRSNALDVPLYVAIQSVVATHRSCLVSTSVSECFF